MAPGRPLKRQKTNPTEQPQNASHPQSSQSPLPPNPSSGPSQPVPPSTPKEESRSVGDSRFVSTNNSPSTQSFFSRTWPRKAPPLTEIARESVSSATNVAQEAAIVVKDRVKTKRSPSLAMTLGKSPPNTSNRSLPADTATTIVNAVPESPRHEEQAKLQAGNSVSSKEEPSNDSKTDNIENHQGPGNPPPTGSPETNGPSDQALLQSTRQAQDGQTGWLTWLSRRDAQNPESPQTRPAKEIPSDPKTPADDTKEPPTVTEQSPPQDGGTKSSPEDSKPQATTSKRNWYQMWGGETPAEPVPPPSQTTTKEEPPKDSNKPPEATDKRTQSLKIPEPPASRSTSQASSLETSPPPPLPGDASKSSGWVFWSRDRNQHAHSKSESTPHLGELAISDTPSQAKPKRASIRLPEDQKPVFKPSQEESTKKEKGPKTAEDKGQSVKGSGDNPQTKDVKAVPAVKPKNVKQTGATAKAESSNATAKAREPVQVDTPRTGSPAPSKKETPNLLLPAFKDTLSPQESPTILQQLARLLYYTRDTGFKHLHVVKDPPRISNALAIGVHGYFPAPLIRSVLGQPTGTSIKFADMAASAIKRWTRSRGYECEVKSAALEGEGRISERVELLWKLLLNWIDEIRKADFVMIACHSQGVPVAIMLVAKLIAFGCISGARVGICAMAGVNMGPFPEYKSRWISGSAGELFEFSDSNSKVSLDYQAAIEEVLTHGVRLTFVGSIDDQLVSMESSIFAPITHPHIYRAVFVDGRIHAPNFLSHLVGFAMKLRNVGVPDHGLIRELSPPLAGSLYSGEGHSRIYEDDSVYDLAIQFALETTTMKEIPITRRPTTSTAGNPYILPFAMRGILEEDYVKTELQNEAQELLAQFDDWKPTTKALKDVKFRLEGIRSKL
ncbi:hypothetical protein B0A52_09046 [Exophiala mesophila]|uniref:YMC020W-like alpha/beta hydrolase domain-containing protein n=1 Tax=Exophiala mesophila TaxID=212818 RepID=A0A438MTE0_EXOME|nr:hypothetical protein B0A52_09046 [Exophiala mesophila]